MAERKAGNAVGSGAGQVTMSEYKKAQARVRDLVEKRRLLERRLVSFESPMIVTSACANSWTDTGRRRHRSEGDCLPRQHTERQHYHGLRQLHEGDQRCSGTAAQGWNYGPESSVFTIIHLVPTQQPGGHRSWIGRFNTGLGRDALVSCVPGRRLEPPDTDIGNCW